MVTLSEPTAARSVVDISSRDGSLLVSVSGRGGPAMPSRERTDCVSFPRTFAAIRKDGVWIFTRNCCRMDGVEKPSGGCRVRTAFPAEMLPMEIGLEPPRPTMNRLVSETLSGLELSIEPEAVTPGRRSCASTGIMVAGSSTKAFTAMGWLEALIAENSRLDTLSADYPKPEGSRVTLAATGSQPGATAVILDYPAGRCYPARISLFVAS
jgi:hypothetical protein